MDRRGIYRRVAELLPHFGGPAQLLDAVADGMRSIRQGRKSISPELGELQSHLHHDDLLGQVYQAINAPALEAAYRATARDRRKFTADEIPAVTQLFTPKWVVEFLLQNTLGKLWLEIHPDSRLGKKWKWLTKNCPLREKKDMGGTPILQASKIRICDPACGTMNFGLVAIDMLREIYREEIDRAGKPGWPGRDPCLSENEIDGNIVRNNLIGFDIDPVAIDLARQSMEIKIGRSIARKEHQLFVKDALFDDSIAGSFDVVVTNPPYLSARNLDAKVVGRLKHRFPCGWRDYYACFMLRSLEMLRPGGQMGILTMHSFMFTGAFERMRREIAERAEVRTVAHFGPGLFDVGNPGTLQTAAIVLQRKPEQPYILQASLLCPPLVHRGRVRVEDPSANRGPAPTPSLPRSTRGGGNAEPADEVSAEFFRLVDASDKRAALAKVIGSPARRSSSRFELTQSDLASLPRSAWMYWISPKIRRAFRDLPTLGQIAPPRQGLATTDNARFVRYWWEVEPPNYSGEREKWKPYAKGGRFRRWYEAARYRVNWEDDGREIKQSIVDRYPYLDGQWQWVAKNSAWYGREGITYSYLTSGAFSARRLEMGTIFDVAGSSLFPDDPLALLGILNSTVAGQLLHAINPTVNFQVGDLRQLPVPKMLPDELRQEVARAIDCTRDLDRFDETSVDFIEPEPWNAAGAGQLRCAIEKAERSINRIVGRLYGIKQAEARIKLNEAPKEDLARRWLSYSLGIWLGRWGQSTMGDVALLSPLDGNLRDGLRGILAERAGESAAGKIVDLAGGLDRFFGKDFLTWHNLLYRGRPVFWGFSAAGRTVAVCGLSADRTVMQKVFREIGVTVPRDWRPKADDGVRLNLAPLSPWIADRKLRESIGQMCAKTISRELTAGCG